MMPAGATLGHVHLQVADLDPAEVFWVDAPRARRHRARLSRRALHIRRRLPPPRRSQHLGRRRRAEPAGGRTGARALRGRAAGLRRRRRRDRTPRTGHDGRGDARRRARQGSVRERRARPDGVTRAPRGAGTSRRAMRGLPTRSLRTSAPATDDSQPRALRPGLVHPSMPAAVASAGCSTTSASPSRTSPPPSASLARS